MKLVLDVSNQAPIDRPTFRSSGAVALICKATEGTSFKDKTLATHRKVADGVPFGSYLFLHPDSTGSEAAFYLDYAKPRPGDIQPIIDAEVLNLGADDLARRIVSCSKALRSVGYKPLLYVSAGLWGRLVASQPYIKSLPVWEAQYPGEPRRWTNALTRLRWRLKGGTVVLWQFTDSYQVGSRHFDASVLLVPMEELLIPSPRVASAGGGRKTAV